MGAARAVHPIGATYWVRVPGFVVAAAALNRSHWMHYDAPTSVASAWWLSCYVVMFAAVGVINLAWHASAPWRSTSGQPWVALITFATWASYSLTIVADLGMQRVRGTAVDLMALAVLVAWSWGPDRERIDDA